MSCHSTSGGIVSTSLARAITGLSEKEVQHIFHALKREAQGMPSPSELDVSEWRSRQYDLLSRMRRMSDTRRDKLRDRLFRSRSESVPDGATFHAWSSIEARARQEVTLREITTAIDLAPPGSQAHLYDLGDDGRPKRVWYASYGSNLHRDRFLNYIQGGRPDGSTRTYDGCTDPTPPAADIPIRFAGARPHFALTSRVWRGGIAFIDPRKGESAQGLGRAYDITINQFDEVVAQENGLPTAFADPLKLDEVLTTGRSVLGNGSYETLLHIGDYEGAPVLTFTAPFSTRDALTKSGRILRTPPGTTTPVRMPVMTNKPSAAYLRMIGGGLAETFDMDEVQQADYLRGCPGGDRWTRQQMVRILRGQDPDPPRATGPDHPKTTGKTSTGTGAEAEKTTGKTSTGATDGAVPRPAPALDPFQIGSHQAHADAAILADLRERGLFPADDYQPRTKPNTTTNSKPSTKPGTSRQRRSPRKDTPTTTNNRRPLPGVKTYRSIEEQRVGVGRWTSTVEQHRDERTFAAATVTRLTQGLADLQRDDATPERIAATEANLADARRRLTDADRRLTQAQQRLSRAQAQRPTRYYARNQNRTLTAWQDEDQRLLDQHRATETALAQAERALRQHQANPNAAEADLAQRRNQVERLRQQAAEYEQRLQETHEIIANLHATGKRR